MEDVQKAMWELNIPLLVNHNEVAPSQHELSPIFALTNVSSDQNIVCLQIMDEIAARHGVKVLQHEKPFAGVNGSGKHSNWGLNTDTGKNLFKPGKTEGTQGDFFAFTAALAYAVASVVYLLGTRRMGTPFRDSLTDEQRALKEASAAARARVFGVGSVIGVLVALLLLPVRR